MLFLDIPNLRDMSHGSDRQEFLAFVEEVQAGIEIADLRQQELFYSSCWF